MSLRRFHKPLQDFLNSSADFSILYNTKPSANGNVSQFVTKNTKRIFILDSSFNPPHLGHYALIKELMDHDYFENNSAAELEVESKKADADDHSILLLLSVKNADKEYAPESFENRIEMMYLMANDLSRKLSLTHNISIGLTKHARFVDKSLSIVEYLQHHKLHERSENRITMTFLVGFDTLVRIFNPQYYLPDKLSTSLDEFMKSSNIFCLTRNDKNITLEQQANYISEIRDGQHEHIPKHWSQSIFLSKHKGDIIGLISSSNVRANILRGNPEWHKNVIPEVRDFITNENLYKPKA